MPSPFAVALAASDALILAEFGEPFELRPTEGAPFTITGVPHLGTGTEPVAAANVQRFWIQYQDLAIKPRQGDGASFAGEEYLVAFVDVQTGGGAYLTLDRVR